MQKFVMPQPQYPLQPSYRDLVTLYKYYGSHMSAGRIETLADDLTNESGCGNWIPAKPGDASGPTIAEVVRSSR